MNIFENRKTRLLAALIITMLLEIFVFNFRHWEGLFYNETPVKDYYATENTRVTGNNALLPENGSSFVCIGIDNIGIQTKNIYINAYYADAKDPSVYVEGNIWPFEKLDTIIYAADSGSGYYRMPERHIVYGAERSHYIKLNTSGVTKNMRIYFNAEYDSPIIIDSISFNKTVPFSVVPLRILCVFSIILACLELKYNKKLFNERVNDSRRQKLITAAVIVFDILICCTLSSANPLFRNTDQMYKDTNFYLVSDYDLLAQAFMSGHLYLEDEPPEALKNMENPYDFSARCNLELSEDEYYKWDVAYFNGKYYIYFGVLPTLIYYLPWRLIFRSAFPTFIGITVNLILIVIFAFLLLKEIMKKWFNDTAFLIYILLSQVLIFSSGTVVSMRSPSFYFMPITMSLALVFMGLWLWIRAMSKMRVSEIAFGSLCMALVALCRPQFLIASFLSIPLFAPTVLRQKKGNKAAAIAAFVIPYIAVAAVTMWYNYARFGSVFDFGANYNLTTNDMTSRGFKPDRIPLGIFAYFFQLPCSVPVFPFIAQTDISCNYMGITITEDMYGGILVTQPILWFIFGLKKAKNILCEKNLYYFALLLPIMAFAVGIADTEMSGILSRYYLDFSYIMLLCAIITALALSETIKTERLITLAVILSLLYDILLFFAMGTAGKTALGTADPTFYYNIVHSIAFWL